MTNILVFGDSIVCGKGDMRECGWVQRLRKFLNKNKDSLVYNLGISSNDSNDLLERFEFEIKQRVKKETVFIFAIGINDSQFVYSQNNFRVLLKNFKENIQKTISLAQKFSSKIIFVGLTPVDEIKTTPISWNTDIFHKNEYIQKYDKTIKNVCKKK